MKLAQILLVALAFGVALNAVEGRRPPPRKFPPPSPSPPPPKSPPPPPPPPPPASFEYPHTCKPGNVAPYGEGAGVDCTPFTVSRTTGPAGSWTFAVKSRTATKRCAYLNNACATMTLGDIKFAINPACRGTVNNNIVITEKSGATYTVSPNYGNDADDGYASDGKAPARTFRIKFKKTYSVAAADGLKVTFSTRAGQSNCDSAAQFFNTKHGLPSGVAQYAYFDSTKKCCGTAVTPY